MRERERETIDINVTVRIVIDSAYVKFICHREKMELMVHLAMTVTR